jgi:hypothetical protein
MAHEQRQGQRRTPGMHDRGRGDGLDRVEQRPELAIDLGERAARDKDIGTGVVAGVCV